MLLGCFLRTAGKCSVESVREIASRESASGKLSVKAVRKIASWETASRKSSAPVSAGAAAETATAAHGAHIAEVQITGIDQTAAVRFLSFRRRRDSGLHNP